MTPLSHSGAKARGSRILTLGHLVRLQSEELSPASLHVELSTPRQHQTIPGEVGFPLQRKTPQKESLPTTCAPRPLRFRGARTRVSPRPEPPQEVPASHLSQSPREGDPRTSFSQDPLKGNTLFQEPLSGASSAGLGGECAGCFPGSDQRHPLQDPCPETATAPVQSLRPRLQRLSPSFTGVASPQAPSPATSPRGFPEQRGRAVALTCTSSWAHRREGTATAARLLCDRSKRAVKMDAGTRHCHYAQGPTPASHRPGPPSVP
ncbi:uncharacterized protein Gm57522 [Mus musculus]|uniref:uncharacterized protein Gm57522 n=1 Tax=Mus musculus TaxID=10090 RepID=UPI0011AE9252|nr:uncharacterized protein LOC115486880 [Mus musculus]